MDRGGVLEGKSRNLNCHNSMDVRVIENNIIGRWVDKLCVNYRVLLQLASGSNFGHFGCIVSTTTWRFTQVPMYLLVAPSLLLDDDWYKGKFCVWNWLVAMEIFVSGLEQKLGQ